MGGSPEVAPVSALFADVVGQPRAVASLRAAARQPVHAYLFRGPAGSGKHAAARAFGAALLCPQGGCGTCGSCQSALAGTHPDLVSIERRGPAVGIEEARQLIGLAHRRPYSGSRQVLVVGDVHLATRSAPALLKTIEEPPGATVFVLLAYDVPPELATVASRCVEVPFLPVPTAAMVSWLTARGLPSAQAELVAEGSGGNLDRARLLVEDPSYAARIEAWRSVPAQLDGYGATASAVARSLIGAAEDALGPLRARHADEMRELAAQAEATGERGVPGRREVTDRHRREERRWRTDELRVGLGVLARTYRDKLVQAFSAPEEARGHARLTGYEDAISLVTKSAASLVRNPNETLLLEALLVRLGRIGEPM